MTILCVRERFEIKISLLWVLDTNELTFRCYRFQQIDQCCTFKSVCPYYTICFVCDYVAEISTVIHAKMPYILFVVCLFISNVKTGQQLNALLYQPTLFKATHLREMLSSFAVSFFVAWAAKCEFKSFFILQRHNSLAPSETINLSLVWVFLLQNS